MAKTFYEIFYKDEDSEPFLRFEAAQFEQHNFCGIDSIKGTDVDGNEVIIPSKLITFIRVTHENVVD